jgi:hypothetical protein
MYSEKDIIFGTGCDIKMMMLSESCRMSVGSDTQNSSFDTKNLNKAEILVG